MANYIKASLKRSYAESFLTELERNENQYFFFIARSTPWTDENSPPVYTDTVASENDVMNNIIAYKKITPSDVYFALPRYDWISGLSYAQYDDSVELFDDDSPKNFYVVTDEYNIYKCLGNSGGIASTEKPSQIVPGAFALSDGYVWQYIATVRESDLPYELSNYFPIDYAYSSEDAQTTNQYNAQVSSVPSGVDRVVMSGVGAFGVSAGVYNKSLFGDSSIRLTSINRLDDNTSEVIVTDANSKTIIGSNPTDYVNYIIRISESTVNPADVNNYGVITSGYISGNQVVFVVKNDKLKFVFESPSSGNAQEIVNAEIIPWIRIDGDGSGAYVFPVMNSDKKIDSVTVASSGINYTKTSAQVISQKTQTTVHPILRVVVSPKEGHGSNILKELNVKDLIIVMQITEEDVDAFKVGGSYRQFGIIKNPQLADGSERLAGTEQEYVRDILLIPDTFYTALDFTFSGTGFILGEESFSSARILKAETEFEDISNFDGARVRLRTENSTDKFITRLERKNDYILQFGELYTPAEDFIVGEQVQQIVPSGTVLSNGVAFSYDLVVTGSVVESSSTSAIVRVTSGGNFVTDVTSPIVGLKSGLTAGISSVKPRYGEYVLIGDISDTRAAFNTRENNQSRFYRVDSVGPGYFGSVATPSYSGLHTLEIVSSVSSGTGGVDVTTQPLTLTSFTNGQVVVQGYTGNVSNYATGTVYQWEFVNTSYGRLHLIGVTGSFFSVQVNGITGSTLDAYIVSSYSPPQIQRNSGEILYIDNVRPIMRVTGQKEEFRLRLGF